MTGERLLSRHEWNVGWDTRTLLDVLVGLLVARGEMDSVLSALDAIAEQEMETYAGYSREV